MRKNVKKEHTAETLSAVEEFRFDKLMRDQDPSAIPAMRMFFKSTKQGCDERAYELMEAAHRPDGKVSAATAEIHSAMGLTDRRGTLYEGVKQAIRKAVRKSYLMMRGPHTLRLIYQPLEAHNE